MPQTMVALLAMLIFSLFAFSLQEHKVYSEQKMVQQAVTLMLNGAAVERLEEIGSKKYDDAVSDSLVLTSSSDLTPADTSYFGPGKDPDADDDIDDFHQATDVLQRIVGSDTLRFEVYSEVQYASEADPTQPDMSGLPTKFKLVTVTARSQDLPDLNEVRVSRSFSCGSACDWP